MTTVYICRWNKTNNQTSTANMEKENISVFSSFVNKSSGAACHHNGTDHICRAQRTTAGVGISFLLEPDTSVRLYTLRTYERREVNAGAGTSVISEPLVSGHTIEYITQGTMEPNAYQFQYSLFPFPSDEIE